MTAIPSTNFDIQALVDSAHESRNENEKPRAHMGCSTLGHVCDRYLWLSFRWAVLPKFPGRILRVFRRGHQEEANITSDLRSIGIDVRNAQTHVNLGCHVSGSLDGIAENGVPGAPKKRHVVEYKTHSKKSFDALVKADSVASAMPMHFVQMQLYMHGTGIDRALYVAVCKDDDRMYTERVRYEKDVAEMYISRGHRIATSDSIPAPISADPSWYQCQYCNFKDFCHTKSITEQVNCRTCALSTAKPDSTWHCEKWNTEIPTSAQYDGCDGHVLHPDLVPWKRLASPDNVTAVYEIDGVQVANGDPENEGVFSSKEILANAEACANKNGGWATLHDLRKQYDGRIVG